MELDMAEFRKPGILLSLFTYINFMFVLAFLSSKSISLPILHPLIIVIEYEVDLISLECSIIPAMQTTFSWYYL